MLRSASRSAYFCFRRGRKDDQFCCPGEVTCLRGIRLITLQPCLPAKASWSLDFESRLSKRASPLKAIGCPPASPLFRQCIGSASISADSRFRRCPGMILFRAPPCLVPPLEGLIAESAGRVELERSLHWSARTRAVLGYRAAWDISCVSRVGTFPKIRVAPFEGLFSSLLLRVPDRSDSC